MNNNILLISGGGSYGAWGAGVSKRLHELGKEYNYYIGTSTGALICALSAANEFDKLRDGYTKLTKKDIFSKNPFTKCGKINIFNALIRIFCKKKTLGETLALKKNIQKMYTKEMHEKIRTSNKKVIICVYNLHLGQNEYKCSSICSYEDFCFWLWASTCVPLFCSLPIKDGYEYVDGGLTENISINYALNLQPKNIDVILHGKPNWNISNTSSLFGVFGKTISALRYELTSHDLEHLNAKNIQTYILPKELDGDLFDSLNFDFEFMTKLWYEGEKSL